MFPLPAALQLVMGAAVFIAGGLIYIRSPALSASDRDILRSVMPDKAARIMQRVGFLPA